MIISNFTSKFLKGFWLRDVFSHFKRGSFLRFIFSSPEIIAGSYDVYYVSITSLFSLIFQPCPSSQSSHWESLRILIDSEELTFIQQAHGVWRQFLIVTKQRVGSVLNWKICLQIFTDLPIRRLSWFPLPLILSWSHFDQLNGIEVIVSSDA